LIHYTVPLCKTDVCQITDDIQHVMSIMSDMHMNLTAVFATGVWYLNFCGM